MAIESEIRSNFKDEYHKALVNLIYTHNYLLDRMNEKFKEYDVTRQQFNVLRILAGQYPKPTQINIIRDRMLDKMSDASRIVDRLLKKGLIEKKSSDIDRRSVEIVISDSGMNLLEKFRPVSDSFNDMLSNLNEEEASTLNTLLDKIRVE